MRHANQRDAQSVEDYNLDDREKWAENGQRQAGEVPLLLSSCHLA